MHGLVDSDILAYEFGAAKEEDGSDLPFPLVMARVDERLEKIKERAGYDTHTLYLTADDDSNFRIKLATIKPYKGNRPKEKSRWWKCIRQELINNYGAVVVHNMEADDAISIAQYKDFRNARNLTCGWIHDAPVDYMKKACGTIICSRDKDLNMVPGWHYGWEAGKCKERPLWYQDEISGLRWFYVQLLIGDPVDNIPGLFGVGPKSALVRRLDDCDIELDMYGVVYKAYQDRFGAYAEQFLVENARLLWMLQREEQLWEPPEQR